MYTKRLVLLVSLLLSTLAVQSATVQLVPRAAAGWKYFIGTQEASIPSTLWRLPGFAETGWSDGAMAMGYGTDDNGLITAINTTIRTSATAPTYTTLFLRKTFNVANPSQFGELNVQVWADDGAIVWLNGIEIGRIQVPPGELTYTDAATVAAEVVALNVTTNNNSILVAGDNTLAVMAFNANTTSSDLMVDAAVSGIVDDVPPTVAGIDPVPGALLLDFGTVDIVFSEPVTGVDASDLLINNQASVTNVATISTREFVFRFPQPTNGPVSVSWAPNTGIADLAAPPNLFAGSAPWNYTLDTNASTAVNVIISEFLAANSSGIKDEDGDRDDWIEILNLGPLGVNLAGWFLTDDTNNLTKWKFPSVTLAASGSNAFLVVWADSEDRTNNTAFLHTSFNLGGGGEFLALVDPRTNIVSAFSPTYPAQTSDISYGRDRANPTIVGYYQTPTPRRENSTSGSGFASAPGFTIPGGVYTNTELFVTITNGGAGQTYYTTNGTTPTTSSPLYTGTPIRISNSTLIKARTFEGTKLPSPIVSAEYNFVGTGLSGTFSSPLPILIINTHGVGISAGLPPGATNRTRGTMTIIDTFRGRSSLSSPPEYIGLIQIEGRGQTSAGFPKIPYNVELNDANGNDVNVGLLGMPSESDWVLDNPYTDKPFIQEFLTFELYEQMGNYSVRRRFVEVFLDTDGGRITYPGNYWGIYCLLEKIKVDENRVDIAELGPGNNSEPEISGGYMFKKDKDSAGDLNFSTTRQTLKIHEPKPTEITTPQLNWIRNYLNQMENVLYAGDWLTRTGTNHYSYYLDVDSFVDNHWIVEFPKQIDGYRLSNYFAKDRGGKLKMTPIWDWNLSWGNADYLEGGRTNGWYYSLIGEAEHIWLRRLISAPGDPDFNQKITDRWSELRTNIMNGDRVLARITELENLLTEPAQRDFARFPRLGSYIWPNPNGGTGWSVDYVNPTTYAGIMNEMRKWTKGRYMWIDAQYPVKAPILSSYGGDPVEAGTQVSMSAVQGNIYYTMNGSDPRASGGGLAAGAQVYGGPVVVNNNARIVARARLGTTWSGPAVGTFVVQTPSIIISEIMYHPAPPAVGSPFLEEDYEYIEIKNVGAAPVALAGYQFTEGLQFTFTGSPIATIDPQQTVLLIRNQAAFNERYGPKSNIAGVYSNNLANEGEQIILLGPLKEVIHDFEYDDDWYPSTDGLGFSLVVRSDNQPRAQFGVRNGWKPSGALNGSPGANEGADPGIPIVYVNEVIAHTDPPAKDAVELHNPNATPADVSYWFLTDDFRTPKFQIPAGTMIPANGYIVFDEDDFNPTPGIAPSFNFRSSGDDVYLLSADLNRRLTGYAHGYSFGATLNGESLGRYVDALGNEHFVRERANTLLAVNAGPKVGPVVISEVMYHPPDVFVNNASWDNTEHEFVELLNISASPVGLFDPNATTNAWRLRDAVSYTFPLNTTLLANERIVVVGFNPLDTAAANNFRARYGIDASVRLFGPWSGRLDNSSESVELAQPDQVVFYQTNQVITSVLVDRVEYSDSDPWPVAADGLGPSLHRLNHETFGNVAVNWVGARATPGGGYAGGNPPVITVQPISQTEVAFTDVSLSVEVTGQGPFQFQWRFNGENVPFGTNPVLTLTRVLPNQAGSYQVIIINDAGSAASDIVQLTLLIPATISRHPESAKLREGTNVTFTVFAESSTPITYQWRFNGQPIPGANSFNYSIPVINRTHAGVYDVSLTDTVGTIYSSNATLTVLIDPVLVSFNTNYTVVQGGSVLLSAEVDGSLPLSYRWRRRTTTLTNEINVNTRKSFRLVTNLQPTTSGPSNFYSLIVTNEAFFQPGLQSPNVLITLLLDGDGDGMPDDWEDQNGLSKTDPADRLADKDGDGVNNGDEYTSGTDPSDPNSYLRIEGISADGGINVVFNAVAGKTYTLLYKNSLLQGTWSKLDDVAARPASGAVMVNDPNPPAARFYRLVTPRQ